VRPLLGRTNCDLAETPILDVPRPSNEQAGTFVTVLGMRGPWGLSLGPEVRSSSDGSFAAGKFEPVRDCLLVIADIDPQGATYLVADQKGLRYPAGGADVDIMNRFSD